ncbi:MAG: adenosylmethionine decarboxylase [Clostridium sp.]
MEQLGRHILVEYYNCDKDILKDHSIIEEYMRNAAIEANATIVTSCFHKFNPWGVSGAVIIQESHLTIHTWPEYGYASVDLFTCGDTVNPWVGFKYLEKVLKSERSESTEVARGVVDKVKTFAHGAYDDMHIKFKMEV